MQAIKTFILLIAYTTIVLGIGAYLQRSCSHSPAQVYRNTVRTDTVFVAQIKHDTISIIEAVNRLKPERLTVYLRDTVYRERLIHDTIISGITETAGKLDISTIAPDGKEFTREFKLSDLPTDTLKIDHRGNVKQTVNLDLPKPVKPNRWRKLGNIGLMILSGVVGYGVHK
jgi:hypothetical protein